MSKLLTTLIAAVFAVTTSAAFAQTPAPSGDAPKTEKKAGSEKKSKSKSSSSSSKPKKSKSSKSKSEPKPDEMKK